ncbi:MAG: hypothetical protein MK324_09895 [Pirellulales bacterium]|nr:hypothetical protein [Rhodopirellula sp.]MCH2370826.1 hypothetical protein [Pirellulales bacterium]|tara:strand:+ start:1186 stop:1845 length:660 start_codon:yes stop_codon:yes gene_type:complete
MQFYKIYEVVGPIILFPLAILLWWPASNNNFPVTFYAVGMPVAVAFLIPYIGIRLLHIWEIRSPHSNLGFRPHHGFMFGSATSVICWLVYRLYTQTPINDSIWLFPTLLGLTIGLINFLFDMFAINRGVLVVFNRSYAEGKSAFRISLQYAPVFFTSFGIVYGFELQHLINTASQPDSALRYGSMLLSIFISPLATEIFHWIFFHESSMKSYKHVTKED